LATIQLIGAKMAGAARPGVLYGRWVRPVHSTMLSVHSFHSFRYLHLKHVNGQLNSGNKG